MSNRYAEVHNRDKLAGPGDARPTALQIIKDNGLEGKWHDKVVLVTGCSSGIGIDTARAVKATGAKVYATVRDLEKGRKALQDCLEPGKCELLKIDLDSLESVRTGAKEFLSKESRLNILINNAGIMALKTRETTQDGFESQFGVNYLAHFLLFQLLKPALLASSQPGSASRVVNLSSSGHLGSPLVLDDLNLEQPDKYTPWGSYGNAKTALIYMANEIERRYGSRGLHATSVDPGGIKTGLQVHSDTVLAMMEDPKIIRFMKSTEQGAATTIWAAVDKEWEGKGGKYLQDCQIAPPKGADTPSGVGYAEWAYDEQPAKQLWSKACQMVGVPDDN